MTDRLELPSWECYELIGRAVIGRLCIVDHECPLAFPVNFRMNGVDGSQRIVIRTAPHTLMARYAEDRPRPASFEVDQIDLEQRTAWSVIARGLLRTVRGPHDLPDPEPWVGDGRYQYLVLEVENISGRHFVGRPSSDGFSVEWEIGG